MSQKLFGTDGVRGVAGVWPLDAPTVARLGAALVRTLPAGHTPHILVGRDTRESGEWIEREFARGALDAGARVTSAGIVPTPAVAYLAGVRDVDFGVVLSASHNPYADNGIKIFSGHGEKFGEAQERAVEAMMADTSWHVAGPLPPPLATEPLVDGYLDHVAALMPRPAALAGTRIAVDMANGATVTTAVRVFERLGLQVVTLGDRPDGRNINLHCGSTHPEGLAEVVVHQGCRIGVAFDGDGDRVILVDAQGTVVNGDALLLMLALGYQRQGMLAGDAVVATVMSNIGLEIALRAHGIRLIRTPVGDKHVMEEMRRGGYVLGGEQSGHVILAEHLPTGDGLATAVAVLRLMAETGRELADLAAELVNYPQTLLNLRVGRRIPVADVPAIQQAIAEVERALAGRGRVLVRYSGTEPLLRIMIEGEDLDQVRAWARQIGDAALAALGQA